MSIVSLMVTADHAVPVEPQGGTATVTVLSGGPVYYADNQQVSSASNQGQIALSGSQAFSSPAWIVSSSVSSVQVSQSGPSLVDVVLGSDGRVGGPGGTALTASVVTDSSGINAPLVDGSANQLVNVPTFQVNTLYPAGYCIQQAGLVYARVALGTSGASFAADVANWTALGSSSELGYIDISAAQPVSPYVNSNATPVAIPGLSLTVSTGARPIEVIAFCPVQIITNNSTTVTLQLYEDGVKVDTNSDFYPTGQNFAGRVVPIRCRRNPAAGSHTYALKGLNGNNTDTWWVLGSNAGAPHGSLQVVQL